MKENLMYHSQNGQNMAVIEAGPKGAPTLLMVHGGPGYYWIREEVVSLSEALEEAGTPYHILAVQSRGCGIEDDRSMASDLFDDGLLERASDLQAFSSPDVLLGHSTGAMIALTALHEGFVTPKHTVLAAPYMGCLGEHAFWVGEKAARYPRAFQRFYDFTKAAWEKYKGPVPADFREKLFIYWGEMFLALPTDEERLRATFNFFDFHVITAQPTKGEEQGEIYNRHKLFFDGEETLDDVWQESLIHHSFINAHWWRQNFVGDYPFEKVLRAGSFPSQLHIVSGEQDDIVPPHIAQDLGGILGITPHLSPKGFHLMEDRTPGDLKEHVVRLLGTLC